MRAKAEDRALLGDRTRNVPLGCLEMSLPLAAFGDLESHSFNTH